MSSLKEDIDNKVLINLFSLFFVGTISFLILNFFHFPEFLLKEGLLNSLFYLGFFSYEMVFLSLSSYYTSKIKGKIKYFIKRNPKKAYNLTIIILGISYIIMNFIIEKSILIFFRDIIMVTLIVTPFIKKEL